VFLFALGTVMCGSERTTQETDSNLLAS